MRVGINQPVHCINIFCGNSIDVGDEPLPVAEVGKHNKPTWKLTRDPSGDFIIGRLFNYMDIESGLWGNSWSEGTRFKNTVTGKEVELIRPNKGLSHRGRALQIRSL